MSVSVKIPLTPMSEVPFPELIDPERYSFGVRGENNQFMVGDISQTIVVFDKRHIGRGVELTFGDNYIEVRLCTPSTTSDCKTFMSLIQKLIDILGSKEIICEEENLDVEHFDEVSEAAKANLKSGLDFITSVDLRRSGPITFAGVFREFSITPANQAKLSRGGQKAFDEFLYNAQTMPRDKEK